jgi:hypothetical protein
VNQAVEGGQPLFSHLPQHAVSSEEVRVREPLKKLQALFAGRQERGSFQNLQVPGGVGHREACFCGQGLDVPLPLCQQIADLDALRAGESGGHAGELLENGILELPAFYVIGKAARLTGAERIGSI